MKNIQAVIKEVFLRRVIFCVAVIGWSIFISQGGRDVFKTQSSISDRAILRK